MLVITTTAGLLHWREHHASTLGFVPTMGYLHDGHLSLVRMARAQNAAVVASIFVNPTQFGPGEDLSRYPRDPERDLALLQAEGVACVFMPPPEEMYRPGATTSIDVGPLATRLEGAFRPGHFRGVATVVCKLLNLVRPHAAYFGEKDAQQLLVIRRMVADLDLQSRIVAVPTVREPDGLAMSSRNVYLSMSEREQALSLWRALSLARERVAAGERRARSIKLAMRRLIQAQPAAAIDYISIADPTTLQEWITIDAPARVSLAVRIGGTRLIDNTLVCPPVHSPTQPATQAE